MSLFNTKRRPAVVVGHLLGDTPKDVAAWAQNAVDQGMTAQGLDPRDRLILEMFKALAILARERPSAPLSQSNEAGE